MRANTLRPFLPALLLAACASPPMLAEGDGAGLQAVDTTAPAGAKVYERPEWHVGDRFTLVRGTLMEADFAVVQASADGYVLKGPGGVQMRRDLDLGLLGEWRADGSEATHLLAPVDVRFHWPLWVGKTWQCEYVDRDAGRPGLRVTARYRVEDLDTVEVPAGTFEALRVVRTMQLTEAADRVLTRTQVVWYAPSVGLEVRQVLEDTEVVLSRFARAKN